MLATTLSAIWRNWVLFVVQAVAVSLISVLMPQTNLTASLALAAMSLFFAYFQVRMIRQVVGTPAPARLPIDVIKVLLKNLVILVPAILAGGAVYIGLPRIFPDTNAREAVGASYTCMQLLWAICMALVGNWIPAGLHGEQASLMQALRRGGRRFLSRAPIFVLSNVVTLIIFAIAGFGIASLGLSLEGILVPFLMNLVFQATLMFLFIFWTVIVTRDYMQAENVIVGAQLADVF